MARKNGKKPTKPTKASPMPVQVVKPKRKNKKNKIQKVPFVTALGFPATPAVTLRYHDNYTITLPTVGSWTFAQFRLHSLYDPDKTFTGHQQYLRDQLATLYRQYIVDSVDVKFTFYMTDGVATGMLAVMFPDTVNASAGVGAATPRHELIEWPRGKYVNVELFKKRVLKKRYYLNQIQQISRKEYLTDVNYEIPFSKTTDPNNLSILNLCLCQANGNNASDSWCQLDIDLKYNCIMRSRIVQPSS